MRRDFAVIRCRDHPWYRGMRPKKDKQYCPSCQVILILAHQQGQGLDHHEGKADKMLGGLNPYQYFDLQQACENLEIVLR